MRLAIAHISQETNTFNPRPSTVGGFEAFGLDLGPAAGTSVELVPIIKARDAGHLDGLALLMHGACASQGEDDVEGHLLGAARAVLGDRSLPWERVPRPIYPVDQEVGSWRGDR